MLTVEIKHNKKHTRQAQSLRTNATPQERHLWYDYLSQYPVRFRRQVTIDRFILDFYCAEAKLAVEIDGSGHYEKQGQISDAERTAILNNYGIMVIRVSNREVNLEFPGVCEYIHNTVKERLGKDPYEQGESYAPV